MIDLKTEKLWLIDQIVKVQDAQLLRALKGLLESSDVTRSENSTDFWSELSLQQKAQIERSIQALDEGEGMAHSDVMQEFRQSYTR